MTTWLLCGHCGQRPSHAAGARFCAGCLALRKWGRAIVGALREAGWTDGEVRAGLLGLANRVRTEQRRDEKGRWA